MTTLPEIPSATRTQRDVYRLISYGLVALMMACSAYTLVNILDRFTPTWQPNYLIGLCTLVAIDRLYTYRRFSDWMVLSQEWLIRYGTEWIILLALAKLVVGFSHGIPAFWDEIQHWPLDMGAYFFTNELLFALAIIMLVWVFSGSFAEQLEEIGPYMRHPDDGWGMPGAGAARRRLINLFFSIGFFLVVLTALGRLDLRAALYQNTYSFYQEIPVLSGGGASTLLYFMLGLALLSQTQFIALHTRWDRQHVQVRAGLARRWALYSVAFLFLVMLIVSLLPTSYSISPILMLGYLIELILYAFASLGRMLLFLYMYLLSLIFSLFGKDPPVNDNAATPFELPEAPNSAPHAIAGGPSWVEVLKSLLFWAVFLGVLYVSARQFLGQHQEVLQRLRRLPGLGWLIQAWEWLRDFFTQVRQEVSTALAARRANAQHAVPPERSFFGFMNLRGLDPRQRVYYYYLALVRRGGENGLTRDPSQTPYEYAATLESALPSIDGEIDALTEAFVDARYSPRQVAPEQASLVERTWARIRKALRGRFRLGR